MNAFLSAISYNTEGTKYAIVILLAPFWIPFLRELWREFNEMLAEEGGLFGRSMTDEELAEILARKAERDASLVTELRDGARVGGRGRPAAPVRARPGGRRITGGPRGFAAADLKRRRQARGGFGGPR